MEFYPLVRGVRLPEVYHLGFNGTHFEIYVDPIYWLQFVEAAGEGTDYAKSQGPAYVPPRQSGGSFGQYGCATVVSNTLEGFTCIQVPATEVISEDGEIVVSMRSLGHTLASIMFILMYLLNGAIKKDEEGERGAQQLFVLETFVSPRAEYHGAGLELSVSPRARKYLESLGSGYCIEEAIAAKRDHYLSEDANRKEVVRFLFANDFMVGIKQYGTLDMKTMGNCACLGVMPRDFGEEGYCITSHNVDTVSQQFNLLVGIAYVWQMVRGCVRMQDKI